MPHTKAEDRSQSPVGPGEHASGQDWHALDSEAVLALQETRPEGLTSSEAEDRLVRLGANRLPAGPERGAFKRFIGQFHNVLIYVLLGAAVLALLLEHLTDAAVVLGVVLVNAAIGFVQEGRAERALAAIRGMMDPKASVLRDGRRRSIPADAIVAGDVVFVEAGNRVPADLRLTRARNLRVDEAILTGESVPVEKSTEPVAVTAALGDRSSMAFSGTFATAGQGVGVAVGTGAASELGRISALLSGVETLKTPLIRQMDVFARRLTFVILGVAALTFAFAMLVRGYELAGALMAVIGLAVAAIPEGLPATMTITLAIGVQRMAARNAIIRRLPAVETLGSVSVVGSDKTGTLTRNEMTVQTLVTADHTYEVTGVGYAPHGSFRRNSEDVDISADAPVQELVRASALCNDAELALEDGVWQVSGDPMEGALAAVSMKAGLDVSLVRKQVPRDDEIPFDAAHRFMATLHHTHEDGHFVIIKGAPERIIGMCDSVRAMHGDAPLDPDAWHEAADRLAAHGQRVLAFAIKPMRPDQRELSFADVESGAVLLGLAGFIDPPREEAIKAVRDCRSAGIRVVMITGDHAVTAREIARQLGLAEDPKTLTGADIDGLDESALRAAVLDTHVFARATPEHKLRLVEALQSEGLIVAMTGDGVNDAPALKRADVGVAMGLKGTEVAKEAAEIVLADDNFASIAAAVREGRTVYDNLMKVIAWTLPTNGGEALTILFALALGLALPITPVQILWINMITAVALGLTLAFEPTEPGTMLRAPRGTGQGILSARLLWRIGFVSSLFLLGAFGIFYWADGRGLSVEQARTLVVNVIVVMEIFYLFSIRFVHGTALTLRGVLGTPAVLAGVGLVVVAQFVFTYAPFMNLVFETAPVGVIEGLVVVAVGVALLLLVEAEKRLVEDRKRRESQNANVRSV